MLAQPQSTVTLAIEGQSKPYFHCESCPKAHFQDFSRHRRRYHKAHRMLLLPCDGDNCKRCIDTKSKSIRGLMKGFF